MGEKIKTAIEIAMEKAARIGELSPEEKEKIENKEKLKPIMAEFYKGKLSPNDLWQRLKGSKLSLLVETQLNLINSLRLENPQAELQKRKKGILALETLKKDQNTSMIELNLNLIEDLQRRAKEEKERAYNNLKANIEKNPQARMREVKQGQATIVMRLSADEAAKQSPQWKQFLLEHERRYSQEFAKIVEKLKVELK
mgnify:CR=1 FL=1